MSEAETKKAVQDYLEIGKNQGRWYWDRLNSGKAWMRYGEKLFPISLCRPGTPDLIVIQKWEPQGAPNKSEVRLVFFEVKSSKGKLSEIQVERHKELREYGAEVYTVKSLDEVIDILG